MNTRIQWNKPRTKSNIVAQRACVAKYYGDKTTRLTRLARKSLDATSKENTHLRAARRGDEPLTTVAAFFSAPEEDLTVFRVVGGGAFTAIFFI